MEKFKKKLKNFWKKNKVKIIVIGTSFVAVYSLGKKRGINKCFNQIDPRWRDQDIKEQLAPWIRDEIMNNHIEEIFVGAAEKTIKTPEELKKLMAQADPDAINFDEFNKLVLVRVTED